MQPQPYYTATYASVPESQFIEWRGLIESLGGESRELDGELIPYNARVANAADARPQAGDTIVINRWNRIDAFTSGGQHYIGIES